MPKKMFKNPCFILRQRRSKVIIEIGKEELVLRAGDAAVLAQDIKAYALQAQRFQGCCPRCGNTYEKRRVDQSFCCAEHKKEWHVKPEPLGDVKP